MEPETLEIVRLGNPVLRRVAEPVPEEWMGSGKLHDFAASLIRTMIEGQGVGLAAPQVAESLRLFAYWLPGPDGEPEIRPTVLVNPSLRPTGDEVVTDWEGCLSIPGMRGVVPRYRRVKVKARDIEGNPVSLTADGFHARVIQHEYDHLDGVVYLDRMQDMASLAFEEEWERYVLPQLSGGDAGA